MSTYSVLLFVHIVCAVIWVGGAFALQLLAVLVSRTGDQVELARLMHYFERIGSRVFVPVATLLFIAGAAMTLQAWSFGKTWIALSVALWVLSAVAGAIYLGPRAKRVGELFDAEGPSSVAGRALMDRLFLVSRLELASFAIVIALMVFKPGT
jgi:uncharacterized membrane protein